MQVQIETKYSSVQYCKQVHREDNAVFNHFKGKRMEAYTNNSLQGNMTVFARLCVQIITCNERISS